MADQTKEYGDMTSRELNEEFELCKTHVKQQNELMRRLMDEAHTQQLRDLESRQEKYGTSRGLLPSFLLSLLTLITSSP